MDDRLRSRPAVLLALCAFLVPLVTKAQATSASGRGRATVAAELQSPRLPDLVKRTVDEASRELRNIGVVPVLRYQLVPGVVDGIVHRQNPPAGAPYAKGHSDTLFVSRAAPGGGRTPAPPTPVPAGQVIDSTIAVPSPPPAAVAPKPPVQPKFVPTLVGMTQAAAEDTLLALGAIPDMSGFEATRVTVSGRVHRQFVAAGTEIVAGAKVAFTIAEAVPLPPIGATMPFVVGRELPEARFRIGRAGFGSIRVDSARGRRPEQVWVVDSQFPRGNIQTTSDAAVRLVVRAVMLVPVPKLVDLTLDSAQRLAGSLTFDARTRLRSFAPRLWGTRVVRQSVGPRELRLPNTVIGVDVTDPIPLAASIPVGLALGLGLATACKGWPPWPNGGPKPPRPPRPRRPTPRLSFRTHIERPAASMREPRADVIRAELSVVARVEVAAPVVRARDAGFIKEEEHRES